MATKNDRLEKVRKELAARTGGRAADPNEWRPPKASAGQELNFKFIVLPPLKPNDAVTGGKSRTDMKELYSVRVGQHWINNKPYTCPRVHDGTDCPYCAHGFALLSETDDQEQRKQIVRAYLPKEAHVVNVYFPAFQSTPPDLQGKVKWVAITQRAVWDKFNACISLDEEQAGGDTPEEQKAWGFFYEPEESYIFSLNITLKNKYNDYSQSKFIPSTRGPIVRKKDGTLDEERLKLILAQRHDLGTKFQAPDVAKLEQLLKAVTKAQPADESEFDEVEPAAPKATVSKPAAKKPVAEELVETTTEVEVEVDPAPAPAPKATVKTAAKPPAPKPKEEDAELDSLLSDLENE